MRTATRRPAKSAIRARLEDLAAGLDLVFFDPPEIFDRAIVGLISGHGQEPAVLYDEQKVIEGYVASGMTADEAQEWFDFNTAGSYLGTATPRFLFARVDDHA